jgi:inner membrane protein
MDNLTHGLVGALIGQAGLKRKTGLAMPALIVGANLPDVDAACFLWLDGVQHVGFRRGITHGPIAWVLLPLILAGLLWGWDRWQTKRGKRLEGRLPVHFGWLYALAFVACLTHPALDWLNVYGIRLLEPFSSRWFYGDVLFIIDVWLWLGLGFATWFSLRREKRGGEWRRSARIALAGALAYIGMNWLISWRAESWPVWEAQTIASPIPVQFWEREVLVEGEHVWYLTAPSNSDDNLAPPQRLVPLALNLCAWPHVETLRQSNPDLDAFLFWSRAPFAERAPGGSVLIRDARFYDPRAADRFTVALPETACESLPPPS